jgi:hypothetical protein
MESESGMGAAQDGGVRAAGVRQRTKPNGRPSVAALLDALEAATRRVDPRRLARYLKGKER